MLTRVEWPKVLLEALESKRLKAATLGPANLFRLRTHPVPEIAQRATATLSHLGGSSPDKDQLIAQLLPAVAKPGNVAHGKDLFMVNCGVCHKLGDLGTEVGPR